MDEIVLIQTNAPASYDYGQARSFTVAYRTVDKVRVVMVSVRMADYQIARYRSGLFYAWPLLQDPPVD